MNKMLLTVINPTVFMKILHFSLFKLNINYMLQKAVDPNTVKLTDYKFMERVFYINVSKLLIVLQYYNITILQHYNIIL